MSDSLDSGKDDLKMSHKFLVKAVMLAGDYETSIATKLVNEALRLYAQQAVEKARIDEHNLVFSKTSELDEGDLAEWSLERLKELGVDDETD